MRFFQLAGGLLAALLNLTIPSSLLAQKAAPDPVKLGQIDDKDLTPTPFAHDSAAAVVLCDFGTTRFEGHGADLRLVFDRVTRIKILTKAGYDQAGQLYLSPLAVLGLDRNPFVHAARQLPVDFGAAREETRLLTLTLPVGYELAELPKGLVVSLPDEGGRFTFAVASTGLAVQLSSRLTLRKPVYSAEEYAHLRDLYRRLLEKQAEKLVIRKKA